MRFAEIVVHVPITASRRPGGPANSPDAAAPLSVASPWMDRTFTYDVPEPLRETIAVGQRVWAPFGPRRLQGIVVGISDSTSLAETRSIEQIVDPRPLLSPEQIKLARWIAHRYLAPLSQCIWLLLPAGIEEKDVTLYEPGSDLPVDAALTDKQRQALDLIARSGHLRSTQIPPQLKAAVNSLAGKGYVVRRSQLRAAVAKPKLVESVLLVANADEIEKAFGALRRPSPKLERIVELLKEEQGPVWVSAVYAATGATRDHLRRLEALGLIQLQSAEQVRDSLAGREYVAQPPPRLTAEQEQALDQVRQGLATGQPCAYLLHGVTGSGKTEIYLRAIEETLKQGRQAIALVPEIALTPQTIQRFGSRFGNRIAVIHSELNTGERYDTWRRARDGAVDVVIGPRSALFAPLPRLGLIVLDEEHDASYKQSPEQGLPLPSYHAREVALELARLKQATVILGSATPAVETYWRAQDGEFKLIELPRRILAHGADNGPVEFQDLPPVEIVDLRTELRSGNMSIFSRALDAAMRTALAAREQVILFLNRRGAATSVVCRECGEAVRCPRCNNPFTVHESSAQSQPDLICHHCGKTRKMPRACPACGSTRIKALGLGTQKLEQVVHANYPGARTLRWDRDVTRGYVAHEAILEAFTRGEAEILIGTQMIAKGLDLPRVTLVGVMNADTGLHLPDLRAGERTFQLLTQVAGRAGRSARGGKAIIQTYSPDNYAVRAAAGHAYEQFYTQEIAFRRAAGYPPFRPLIRLLLADSPEQKARTSAESVGAALRDRVRRLGMPDVEVIGPAPAFFAKWQGKYRYQLLLKGQDARPLLETFPLPTGWRIDVDPLNLL